MGSAESRGSRAGAGEIAAGPEVQRAPGVWLREHAGLVDLLVVLAVLLYNLPILPVSVAPGPMRLVMHLLSVGLCLPFLLRRRFPLAVFGTVLALAFLQVLLGTSELAADVMLLFVTYNVATRFTWRISLPAAALVVSWLWTAQLPKLGTNYLSISDLVSISVVTILVWMWGTLVRTRRDYIASLQERARQLEREKDAQAQIAVAAERARIAREIHDIVSHSLSVVVVMSEAAASKVYTEPERARTAILGVRDTGRSALTDMRRALGVLRDGEPGSHAPQPGVGQLDQLITESVEAGLPLQLSLEGRAVALPPGLDLTVFRIVQEALTNVRKHAGPVTRVEVRLRYTDEQLHVRVTDDGQGLRGEQTDVGHGLVGMQERTNAYGGTLHTGMRPGGGFEVTAVLPIEENQ